MKRTFWILAALVALSVPHAALAQNTSVTLTWTSPGDDAGVGTATSYQMKFSSAQPDTTTLTAFNTWWAAASGLVTNLPAPLIAGTTQTVTITTYPFAAGRNYYFVLRAYDEALNASAYSNVAVKFFPIVDVTPPSPIINLRAQ